LRPNFFIIILGDYLKITLEEFDQDCSNESESTEIINSTNNYLYIVFRNYTTDILLPLGFFYYKDITYVVQKLTRYTSQKSHITYTNSIQVLFRIYCKSNFENFG